MNFHAALEKIKSQSLTEAEKGARFERLIKAWLMSDPLYRNELEIVWLWEDFPFRDQFGVHDLGIDLVGRTKLGEYWAIQCKFYGENTVINKAQVDSFISNSSRIFYDKGIPRHFDSRLWISTNDYFNENANEIVSNQSIPFIRISPESMAASPINWAALLENSPIEKQGKKPQDHQLVVLEKTHAYFKKHDRGKLLMACGTGKTYTAQLIAEKEVKPKGSVLFLLPSISLVNQTLNAWMGDATKPIKAICICSDAKASRKKEEDSFEGSIDLALPATTDPHAITERYLKSEELLENDGMIVVFSTYQSIDAVANAQKAISDKTGQPHSFDLIVCDEAHRTTGVIKSNADRSDFTKIHDNDFIRGAKRLYMTATARIYADNVKIKAKQSDYILCSMDDVKLYGEEIHHVSFGYAVANKLLTDYKVLVLTVGSEHQLPEKIREIVHDPNNKELNFDFASRLVGCVHGLAKNTTSEDNKLVWTADPRTMKRAIAFCPNIDKKGDPQSSTNTANILPLVADLLFKDRDPDIHHISVEARHIDGTMDTVKRASLLRWLAEENSLENECRVLTNVRCLSEGIDVPALDAAIFLSPRSSQVEVVQSVGRVMRNFKKGLPGEKKFGYIIIPVVVNPNIPPEEALNDNKSFAVVWSVLNALRAHDERFNAMINSIALNDKKPIDKVVVDSGKLFLPDGDKGDAQNDREADFLKKISNDAQFSFFGDLDNKLYAKMVEKVGSRLYWEQWATKIAPLARTLIDRVGELVAMPGDLRDAFSEFVTALRASINSSISDWQAIEMLGQHMITRPVFEALFADYHFDTNNAVSRAMKNMADKLEARGLAKDRAELDKFYESVKLNLGQITTLHGKQTVIKNLYDSFFKRAFPRAVEQLGIVYTPIECVDFILHSVDAVLRREFNAGLTDKDVHILDPFTGTGSFITRLLQSGLIKKEDLERKYRHEIHCNEIVLLAYYVADVNIESVYHDLTGSKTYLPYDGITLTDTFELSANVPQPDRYPMLKENIQNLKTLRDVPIRVIVGNPPYSAGQKSGNDNAQNLKYPDLDKRIEETYVAKSSAVLKNSLYDSYIRAFRWASDMLRKNDEGGVIGFVTNSKWLDGNAAAGFRECLEEEFSSIYIFDLKGAVRGKSGELAKKEGGNVFDIMTGVCLILLVYNPTREGKAVINYCDIGDYLSREQKLKILFDRKHIFSKKMNWRRIIPNEYGDWLKQRSDLFGSFIIIGDKKDKQAKEKFFRDEYSRGLATSRDAWCHNFSKEELENNIKRTIDFYNNQCEVIKKGGEIDRNPKLFSWTDSTLAKVRQDKKLMYEKNNIRISQYRPFVKSNLYFSRELNERVCQIPQLFPTPKTANKVICLESTGSRKDFSCIIADKIPDLHLLEACQCFPLYHYKPEKNQQLGLLGGETRYRREDGLTDWILKNVRGRFGNATGIQKETIFYYVYGILHSPDYRARFNDDLKKSLPRIPIVETVEDFMDFAIIGERLADLHLDYEKQEPWPDLEVEGLEKNNFRLEKIRFGGKQGAWDKTVIHYNHDVTIKNIPLKAYEYVVNGRSAIEWIMEGYRIKTDKDSGLTNDPNKWMEETNNPRYVLDLLLGIVTLSMRTLELVEKLPRLEFKK